jgi:pimeloyl-ACP methyl ester carboxylesterase
MIYKVTVALFVLITLSSCGGASSDSDPQDGNSKKTSLIVNASGVDENNKFYFFKGHSDEVYLFTNSTKSVAYKLVDAPLGIELDGSKITLSKSANAENVQLKVQASNDKEFGETTINLRGLEPVVLIDEVTSGGAELFTDQYNLVQINIPEINNVPVETKIQYIGAKKDDDLWVFQALIDESIDSDSIEILLLGDSAKFNTIYGRQSAPNQKSIKALNTILQPSYLHTKFNRNNEKCNGSTSATPHYWAHTEDTFIDNTYRVGSGYFFGKKHPTDASILCSSEPHPNNNKMQNKIPILFIHGFHRPLLPFSKLFGGDNGTWGKFLDYAKSWGDDFGRDTIIFNFQWRTNAKFQVVASDLRDYIAQISLITGERVHIIAHSFGGVLARVYLQGLANSYGGLGKDDYGGSSYGVPVASLTTIGTPHSGLGDEGGYDTKINIALAFFASKYCQQISCYQMGDDTLPSFSKIYEWEKIKKNITLNEITNLINRKDFISVFKSTNGIPIQILIGLRKRLLGLTWGTGDGLISYDGQRFKANDVISIFKEENVLLRRHVKENNAIITEDFLDTKTSYVHTSANKFGGTPEVEVESEYHPSVIKSKSWIANNLLNPVDIRRIKYTVNIVNQYGNPYNGRFKVISKDGSILTTEGNAINGVATIHIAYKEQALRWIEFNIEPTNNLLYSNNPRIVIFEPENYIDIVNTGKTINLRSDFYDESDDVITGKIKLNSATQTDASNFTINGENLLGDIRVCVIKYGGYCQNVEILSKNNTSIEARLDSLGGVRKVFAEKKNSLGVNIDNDSLGVNFVKIQDNNLSISTLTPDNINASDYIQKITINGSGFTRDSFVHAQEGKNSYELKSSRFIDENTISFKLRTGLNTQSPWYIWVETSSKKSNKLALVVNTNVNNTCTANDFEHKSCSIANGVGWKYRSCAVDGNSWSEYSSCYVRRCNNGYHLSGTNCVADVVNPPTAPTTPTTPTTPVPDRPSGLTPGGDSDSPSELDTTNTILRWSATNGVSKYKLSIFDLNIQSYVVEDRYVEGSSFHTNNLLRYGHKYFWSLHACNSDNKCSSRTRVYFNIAGKVVTPDMPTGLTPGSTSVSNPERVSGATQELRWNTVSNASWYRVDVIKARLSKSGKIIFNNLQTNNNSYTVNNLEAGKNYWWSVEACNDDGCSDDSRAGIFINDDVKTYDFYLSNASLSKTSIQAGGKVTARVDVNYSGNVLDADMSSVNTGYYLSSNSNFDSNDKLLDDDSSSLGSDDTSDSENQTLSIPKNLSSGIYYILFVTDYNNRFNETNENNNIKYVQMNITACPLRHFQNSDYEITEDLERGQGDKDQGGSKTQIRQLQEFLNEVGFDPNGIDGLFGPGTESAVKAFQKSEGLTADGKVGHNTRRAINESCD